MKGFLDQLTMVRHANHKDYWIICKSDTNTFAAFLYDKNGIHAPVFSTLPKKYSQLVWACTMKANNKGDLLALTNFYREDNANKTQSNYYTYYHLYHFNQSDGSVTFDKKIEEFSLTTPYSLSTLVSIPCEASECAFSPNDSILYINTIVVKNNLVNYPLYQYQIYSNNISGTRKQINPKNSISAPLDVMQLAPNGKIFVGSQGNSYLACIENPNTIGDACNFNMMYLPLPNYSNSVLISNVFYEYKKVSFTFQKESCKTLRFTINCDTNFVSFIWYFGDGDSANGNTVNHTYFNKGKFIVKLKAMTKYGYTIWNSQEVFTTEMPQINFNTDNRIGCQYIAVKFNDLIIPDTIAKTVNYLWDFGDGTTQAISINASDYNVGVGSVNHVYNHSGKYTVRLTFNNGFCENSIEKNNVIDIMPAPKPGIITSIKNGCAPTSIRFTDTLTSNVLSKEYDFGNGILVSLIPNHSLDTIIKYDTGGNYFIHQKLTGPTGCITEDTLTIKLLPGIDKKIKPEIYYATYLDDRTIEVAWKPVLHATNYQLKINTDILILSSEHTRYKLNNTRLNQPNQFQLSATDTCGNISQLSEITKTVYLNSELVNGEYILVRWTPYASWKNGVEQYHLERKIGNRIDWENVITGNNIFQYADELNNFDTITSCEICYLVVAYESGNNLKESRSNKVCTYLKPTIFVPSAFSPNNDGMNDYFKPIGMGIDGYEMSIYDRWGGLIFETKSDNGGWDGKLANGSLAIEGMYLYTIQTRQKQVQQIQKVFNLKGTIVLNR